MSLEASASSAARYCVRKVLSASRQHLDIGKHVTLGTADIVRCAPSVTGFDSRNLGAGKTTAGSVNLIRGKQFCPVGGSSGRDKAEISSLAYRGKAYFDANYE